MSQSDDVAYDGQGNDHGFMHSESQAGVSSYEGGQCEGAYYRAFQCEIQRFSFSSFELEGIILRCEAMVLGRI